MPRRHTLPATARSEALLRALRRAMLFAVAWACPLAGTYADDDDEAWLNGASERSAASVNEGQLHFMAALPDKPVHHHDNEIIIDESGLASGWVELRQCHYHLDAVARSQIVFHREHIRALRILEAQGIDESWIEGHTIQLSGTSRGARICLSAESRALSVQSDGTYLLRNGPYLRRFLDGYYPMRVSMRVRLRTRRLNFVDSTPPPQVGFRVWQRENEVNYDAQFEGRLITLLRFAPISN